MRILAVEGFSHSVESWEHNAGLGGRTKPNIPILFSTNGMITLTSLLPTISF